LWQFLRHANVSLRQYVAKAAAYPSVIPCLCVARIIGHRQKLNLTAATKKAANAAFFASERCVI